MKTTRTKVIVIATALLAVVSLIPSTFSWYTHNSIETGNRMHLEESTLPVSMKTGANTITMKTYTADDKGNRSDSEISSSLEVAANSVQHYQTVFKNTGSDAVMVDFNGSSIGNNSDYFIGTEAPTINEKCYASRAARTKKSSETIRVYFKSNQKFYPYWTKYEDPGSTEIISSLSGLTNDMNIAYKLSTSNDVTYKKLKLCNNYDNTTNRGILNSNNNETDVKNLINDAVFYTDIPTNVEYFFFFNHYYSPDSENKNWNSTVNITDFSQGKVFAMTGASDGNSYKVYEAQATNTNLVALNNFYSEVNMSLGESITADIGLKKTGDDENFIPDYFGQTITYQVETQTGDAANLITVNRDGLIIPNTTGITGTSHVKIIITGQYGDTKTLYTKVNIPESISQIPIMKNILIEKSGSKTSDGKAADEVVVEWYVKNKSSSAMTLGSVFFTI